MVPGLLLLIILPLKPYHLVAQIFITPDQVPSTVSPPDLLASRFILANHSTDCSKVNFFLRNSFQSQYTPDETFRVP